MIRPLMPVRGDRAFEVLRKHKIKVGFDYLNTPFILGIMLRRREVLGRSTRLEYSFHTREVDTRRENASDFHPVAREIVRLRIAEEGFFCGLLGRERVSSNPPDHEQGE